jgi:hypothetical protein
MQIDISDVERTILIEVVDKAYGELKEEIYHTESYDYKDQLREREAAFVSLRQKLTGETISRVA